MNFDRTEYLNLPSPIEKELKVLFEVDKAITIFEVGACEGEDSIKYSRIFPNSVIYTFEPLPGNVRLIEENLLRYNVKNVYCVNKALSSEKGVATFYVSEGRPENAGESDWDYGNKSSSLLPPEKHIHLVDFIKFKNKIEVDTITLKSFCVEKNITLIDFMHMDVQGAELMVLHGAKDMINNIKCIWLEVSKVELYKNQPLVEDIQNFMEKHNFALVKNEMEGHAGDQMYLSKKYFPNYKKLIPTQQKRTLLNRILKKIGLSY